MNNNLFLSVTSRTFLQFCSQLIDYSKNIYFPLKEEVHARIVVVTILVHKSGGCATGFTCSGGSTLYIFAWLWRWIVRPCSVVRWKHGAY